MTRAVMHYSIFRL